MTWRTKNQFSRRKNYAIAALPHSLLGIKMKRAFFVSFTLFLSSCGEEDPTVVGQWGKESPLVILSDGTFNNGSMRGRWNVNGSAITFSYEPVKLQHLVYSPEDILPAMPGRRVLAEEDGKTYKPGVLDQLGGQKPILKVIIYEDTKADDVCKYSFQNTNGTTVLDLSCESGFHGALPRIQN